MRVLLVDDDAAVLRFLEDVLRSRGHEVVSVLPATVACVDRCVAAAESLIPDLLIVDLRMPIDPARVSGAVRAVSPRAVVVLCTGSLASPEEQARIGVDALLRKPFASSDLDRVLRTTGETAGAEPV